ncbi:hypothetical protein D3C72_2373190 [compost metagenome]
MRHWTADKGGMQHAGQHDVGDETAASGEMAKSVLASVRLPYMRLLVGQDHHSAASPMRCAAVASIASTIAS